MKPLSHLLSVVSLFVFISFSSAQDAAAIYADESVPVGQTTYHFRLMKPAAEATEKQFPLVLFLHGAGERGTDNLAQLKFLPIQLASAEMRKKFPCFVLAPQCEPNKQWVDAPWGDKTTKPMTSEPSEMMRCAIAALSKIMKDPKVDPQRIYLTGLSMGGYGSWELAIRHPEWFAAVAPICGGGDETKVAVLKSMPVWAFHGLADTVVWPERTQRMFDSLQAAGGKPKFTKLEGVGHGAWGPAYDMKSGLLDWLFAQKKTAAPK